MPETLRKELVFGIQSILIFLEANLAQIVLLIVGLLRSRP